MNDYLPSQAPPATSNTNAHSFKLVGTLKLGSFKQDISPPKAESFTSFQHRAIQERRVTKPFVSFIEKFSKVIKVEPKTPDLVAA